MGISPLSIVIRYKFSNKNKDFQSHGNESAEDSSPHEKLHLLYCSVVGVFYDLINVLGPTSVTLQP